MENSRSTYTSIVEYNILMKTAQKCLGHSKQIHFVEPVFQMEVLSFIKNILNCICIRCCRLLAYKNAEDIANLLKITQHKERFNEIRSICKEVTHCQKELYGCGTPSHKIIIDKKYDNVFLLAEPVNKNGKSKKRQPCVLSPQFCYDILKNVSDEDWMILGFDPKKFRPEDMIIVNFPVPPVQARPFTTTDDKPMYWFTHKQEMEK
jgi:DNA-directed RNA polymerase beta' subunit